MVKKKLALEAIVPVPDDVEVKIPTVEGWGQPRKLWEYLTATSGLIGLVCRFEVPDEPDVSVMYSYCHHKKTGKCTWSVCSFPEPYPLFNLDWLSADNDKSREVWVVCDEAAADAMNELFSTAIATTWPCSAENIKKTDWSVLKGRHVCLWPNNDKQSRKAMDEVAHALKGKVKSLHTFPPPEEKADGWNAQDALREELTEKEIRRSLAEWEPEPKVKKAKELPPPDPQERKFPFKFLGYNHNIFYYQTDAQSQVIPLQARQHSDKNLISLAPYKFWQKEFEGKHGPSWTQAADEMFRRQEKVGAYDTSRLRGRGIWLDEGRVVEHLGNMLRVDGQPVKGTTNIRSNYIYEARPRLPTPDYRPLSAEYAVKVRQMSGLFTWVRPIYKNYFSGWLALAPICGALSWRPAIWVNGPAGSGKTWGAENIVLPLQGDMKVHALGDSSAAGIRQQLYNDALPVIIDEAEAKDDKRHLEAILTLMRQSASDTGAKIYKGTQGGSVMEFSIRSAFCFFSVGVGLTRYADTSRITILSLMPGSGPQFRQQFRDLKAFCAETINRKFAGAFRARSVSLLMVIKKNAETFSDAVADVLGSKRVGDQVGALLAGDYSLDHDEVVDYDTAREWVEKQDWTEEVRKAGDTDEEACLQTLLQATVLVQTEKGKEERNIGELIKLASRDYDSEDIYPSEAHEQLNRWGIRIKGKELFIASKSTAISKALENTDWSINYAVMLRRLPKIESGQQVRFTPGYRARTVRMPLDVIIGDEGDE